MRATRALAAGADEFLPKPIHFAELGVILGSLADRPDRAAPVPPAPRAGEGTAALAAVLEPGARHRGLDRAGQAGARQLGDQRVLRAAPSQPVDEQLERAVGVVPGRLERHHRQRAEQRSRRPGPLRRRGAGRRARP